MTLGASLAAVLALGAILASSAFALEWQINGARLGQSGNPTKEAIKGAGNVTLQGKILGTAVEVGCNTTTENGAITAGGAGEVNLALSGCSLSSTPTYPGCVVQPVTTLNARSRLKEFGETRYDLLELKEEAVIAIEECRLAGEYGVQGTLATSYPFGLEGRGSQPLWIQPAYAEATHTSLTVGGSPAEATGVLIQALAGTKAGSSWGEYHHVGTLPKGWSIEGSPLSGIESAGGTGGPVRIAWGLGGTTIEIKCSESSIHSLIGPSETGAARLNVTGCNLPNGPYGCVVEKP